MRVRVMLMAALLAGTSSLAAAETGQYVEREKALMLYFSKSFGSTQRQNRTPLNFGLRLQQTSPLDSARSISLLDMRYSLNGQGTLAFAGVPAVSLKLSLGGEKDSSGDSSDASTSVGNQHPGWTAAMIIVAVLGAACLAEWGLCEDDGGYREPTISPTPSGSD